MAQGLPAGVVYALKAGRASARLHTGDDEMVSVLKSWPEEFLYHVLGEVIFYESTVDNPGRVSKSRP
jgi:hypothetical protein